MDELEIRHILTDVGRLTILNPAHPVLLVPILLAGFVVNPAWYIWLGLVLWRRQGA